MGEFVTQPKQDRDGDGDGAPAVVAGNAAGHPETQGWFVGHFMGDEHPLQTADLEVKWSVYEGGEARAGWGANRAATTLAVLVRGRFRLEFPGRVVWLEREGDFARWRPGVPHFWQAAGPTVVLTMRWPSLPGDSYAVESRSRGVEESRRNDDES